jgi:hypothetical protein
VIESPTAYGTMTISASSSKGSTENSENSIISTGTHEYSMYEYCIRIPLLPLLLYPVLVLDGSILVFNIILERYHVLYILLVVLYVRAHNIIITQFSVATLPHFPYKYVRVARIKARNWQSKVALTSFLILTSCFCIFSKR